MLIKHKESFAYSSLRIAEEWCQKNDKNTDFEKLYWVCVDFRPLYPYFMYMYMCIPNAVDLENLCLHRFFPHTFCLKNFSI